MEKESFFLYSYRQMLEELEKLWKKYPGKIRMEALGWSGEGRCILEVLLGKKMAGHHILIQAGIHGREYLNSCLMIKLMDEYLWSRESSDVCLHIVPMVNPDGVEISGKGRKYMKKGNQRKLCVNRAYHLWKANAGGVDLNRNFDAGWQEYEGEKEPGSEGFKGKYPASEPETRALLKAVKKIKPDCCISYHSSGSLIYWDYGGEGTLFQKEKHLAEIAAKITGYPLVSAKESGVDAAGCSDYFVRRLGIPAVTIETGKGECPLKEAEFEEIYQRNKNLWKALEGMVPEEKDTRDRRHNLGKK
ncbi:MAG: M14 family zinc carboxypeptidase [Eubacteriales bacterium]|nr:M14 family zinc carboxypeptidase [Eubacteriales bacterium]